MNNWLGAYTLWAETKEDMDTVLSEAFGLSLDGEVIASSHSHSFLYEERYIETGDFLLDENLQPYPEVTREDGCYVRVSVKEPIPTFNAYAVEPNESVSDYYEKQAQIQLSVLESSNVVVDEVEYQVRQQDIDRINQKIGWMQRNAIESVEWIVADNTTQTCTIDDLYKILDAQQARQDAAIQQYTEWRLGDKQTPFEPTL